jgi:hypothetical protein
MTARTTPLDGSEWALLREQVATVQGLVTRRYSAPPFNQSLDDLEFLQRLLDDGTWDETERDQLRAVGACFGNVVAKQLGFEWVADEGPEREPALRLKPSGALVIQLQRLVAERAIAGTRVDLAAMVADIKKQVARTRIL